MQKLQRRKKSRTYFQNNVMALDKKCMNPYCVSINKRKPEYLHAHHIMPVGRGGSDRTDNGLTFCIDCHPRYPHEGFKHPITGKRLTGHQFVIMCLIHELNNEMNFNKTSGEHIIFRWLDTFMWLLTRGKFSEF